MSEAEKKGSKWPWILVPVGAVSLFFVLRECQDRLPPAEQRAPAEATPAPPASP
jgi:hypothetical protein